MQQTETSINGHVNAVLDAFKYMGASENDIQQEKDKLLQDQAYLQDWLEAVS